MAFSSTFTSTATARPILGRKVEDIAAGLPGSYTKNLLYSSENNASIIIEYIGTLRIEINLSDNYRKDLIKFLCRFSKHNENRPFKELTRADVIRFLDTLRKTETRLTMSTKFIYSVFSSGLYYPNVEPTKRPKPSVTYTERKSQFTSLLICGRSKMISYFLHIALLKGDKCYHAISRDLSCRPHELLKLKNRDVSFKTVGSSHAEVVVNGK